MSQKHKLLNYLRKYGSVTHLEAERHLNICRVAARVCELRKMGFEIRSMRESNGQASWVRYRLIEWGEAAA